MLYTGIVDCTTKIFRTEGMYGFYKGMTAAIIKNGPHTMLCLMFWQFWRKQYYSRFKNIDIDAKK